MKKIAHNNFAATSFLIIWIKRKQNMELRVTDSCIPIN